MTLNCCPSTGSTKSKGLQAGRPSLGLSLGPPPGRGVAQDKPLVPGWEVSHPPLLRAPDPPALVSPKMSQLPPSCSPWSLDSTAYSSGFLWASEWGPASPLLRTLQWLLLPLRIRAKVLSDTQGCPFSASLLWDLAHCCSPSVCH